MSADHDLTTGPDTEQGSGTTTGQGPEPGAELAAELVTGVVPCYDLRLKDSSEQVQKRAPPGNRSHLEWESWKGRETCVQRPPWVAVCLSG